VHSARRRSALSPSLFADPWRPGHPSPWRPGRRRLPRNLQAAVGTTSFPPQPPPRRAARLRCGGGGPHGEHLSPRAPAARRPPPCSLPLDPAVKASWGSRRAVARPARGVAARARQSCGEAKRRRACMGAATAKGQGGAVERQPHGAAAGAPLPFRGSNAFKERGDAILHPLSPP